MKTFSLLVAVGVSGTALLMTTPVASQSNPEKRAHLENPARTVPVPDYAILRQFERGRTTLQEVKKMLGAPTAMTVDQKGTEWFYRHDQTNLRIQFDDQQRVSSYRYQTTGSNDKALNSRNVKAIRVGANEAEVLQQFGPPAYATLSASGRELAYEAASHATNLRVVFGGSPDGGVTDYLFSEKNEQPVALASDQLMQIERGKTTQAQLSSQLGTPTQKLIDKNQERWLYQSGTARLLLNFNRDPQETVAAYQYNSK